MAIQALTNANETGRYDIPSSITDNKENPLDSHKARFQGATSQYFALLSSIDVRLRRQVYALEEAAILTSESSASRASDVGGVGGGATGGTVNPLDVSWLNSRNDTVGKDKEAELWAAARKFGEKVSESSLSSQGNVSMPRNMDLG